MPYIPEDEREMFEPALAELTDLIRNKGQLNYVITRLLILRNANMTYEELSNLRSVLLDVYDEYTRFVLEPYEDTKIEQNGNVY